ncbi:MAG: helix-turn-helix domain-containing protein [Acetobacterium sp.]|nr:helix-turn-helix domain-containing protein [Bacillota bacterium]MCG2730442.1 helix-turn-helix domain-containing protein [Acetobacterium sp.]
MMDMKEKQNSNRIRVKSLTDDQEPTQMIKTLFSKKRSFERKKAKLVAVLLSCRGLQHIIDVGYEVLGNPMFVSDMGYNVLAFNQNAEVGDPSWPTTEHEEEFEAYERIKKLNDSGVFERLYTSEVPCIEHFDYSPTRWMAHKLTIKEKNIGHIAVVESNKIFLDADLELLQFLCSIVASELQKENVQSSQFENEFEHFLMDMLGEKISKEETIQRQAKKLNLNAKKYAFVITISSELKVGNGMSLSYVRGIINRLLGTEKSIVYQNKITVLLLSDKKEPFSSSTEDKLVEFLKSNEMNAGISTCFQELAGLKNHYTQSVKALELGVSIHPDEKRFYYEEYSFYHLLELAGDQTNLKDFCNPVLLDLIAYDQQYKTNYCHNLFIHLQNDGNVTKTSQHFQIHRNSMKYRIKKIEEIIDTSLNDMEAKFSLLQSFKILTYLGAESYFTKE